MRVFHKSFSRWSFTEVCVTVSPLKSPGLFSILAVLHNAVIWMVSTHPPISKSSSPFNNLLVTVPKTPITIGIIVTIMFHSLSIPWQGSGTYLSLHILSVLFCGQSGQQSRQFCKYSFFRKVWFLAEIRWSVCMSKSPRSLCLSFSRTAAGLCIYHLFVCSNLNFLHFSQWITLPTQSCLVFYSVCANLLNSLIMWLMVSSLSPYNLHRLFCCVLSILALIWLVLMAFFFFAAIWRDSVSLIKFPFLSQVQVFLCEIVLISRLKRISNEGHCPGIYSFDKVSAWQFCLE